MNYSYVCKNPLIIAIASLLLSASFVQAEIQLDVEPEKLTIAGTNRDKIKRTLFLIANKPISPANLEISFRELNPVNKNETFGERPFGDYFSLLAWGFGAEASREAIANAVAGWGLSGLDKN